MRNYTTPFGEADIVARSREGTYCFIEVKSRESDAFGDPTEAVTEEKRRRYRAIALFFCSTIGEEPACRFDVAAVRGGEIEYIENAF